MRKKWLWALGLPALALGVAFVCPERSRAADHLDGPRASNDPASDITDVYAFMSPDTTNGTGHVVLVMNVFPKATTTSAFSDKVQYVFDVRQFNGVAPPTLDTTKLDVTCTFSSATNPQSVTCNAPGGLTKTVNVNAQGATCALADDICVWAGPRSDPFYFDLKGFNDTVGSNPQMAKFTGTNFFQGLNVLSLVVELNALKAFGTGDIPLLGPKAVVAVGAHTNRM